MSYRDFTYLGLLVELLLVLRQLSIPISVETTLFV